ncbi:coiled-coil domain-containing protein 134-like [Vespa velutina]|uniref:coiled-coil domain-containing protein 134-like n=1 Tax=Vespa velutina TaxID=202808 RepID=UPI001FB2BFD9|nr:coiled-coil domain-containing protein 134-like [Vespa velutina]
MQKKLLFILMYIKFLLMISTVAKRSEHTKEQTSKFKLPTKYHLLKSATFQLEPNGELFKKSLLKNVQGYEEAIKILEDIDTYERRYKMIKQITMDAINIIEDKTSMLENIMYNMNKGIVSNNDAIIESLFFILEQTSFFGKVVLNFPDITRKILKNQNKWKETIIWSLHFANKMQHLLDESIITIISSAIEELNNTRRKSESTNYEKSNHLSNKKKFKKGMSKQKRGPKLIRFDL